MRRGCAPPACRPSSPDRETRSHAEPMRTHASLFAMLMLLVGSTIAAKSTAPARGPALLAFRDAAVSTFGMTEGRGECATRGARGRKQQPVVTSVSRRRRNAEPEKPPPQPEPEQDRSRSNLGDAEVANLVGAVSCGGVMC